MGRKIRPVVNGESIALQGTVVKETGKETAPESGPGSREAGDN